MEAAGSSENSGTCPLGYMPHMIVNLINKFLIKIRQNTTTAKQLMFNSVLLHVSAL
jgi:hypothetical protein